MAGMKKAFTIVFVVGLSPSEFVTTRAASDAPVIQKLSTTRVHASAEWITFTGIKRSCLALPQLIKANQQAPGPNSNAKMK
jgi:hypothetical protein